MFPASLLTLDTPWQVDGDGERPRLAVYRSNQHIYAQARGRLGSVVADFAKQHCGMRTP